MAMNKSKLRLTNVHKFMVENHNLKTTKLYTMYKSKKRGCESPPHRRATNGWAYFERPFFYFTLN